MPLLTFNHVKVFILVFYLFAVLIIIALSWLYHNRTIRVTKAIGLHAPAYIRILVRISITNALLTAFLIGVFLILTIR